MVVRYLSAQRHTGTVAEIAKVKFSFPNDQFPDFETTVNEPVQQVSVGKHNGKDLFPDIVVMRRPGSWLKMMAEVEMVDTITDEQAKEVWLPDSQVGDLYIYVPYGMAGDAKQLCRKHGVKPKGIRTWRFRPVWGLDVGDA